VSVLSDWISSMLALSAGVGLLKAAGAGDPKALKTADSLPNSAPPVLLAEVKGFWLSSLIRLSVD